MIDIKKEQERINKWLNDQQQKINDLMPTPGFFGYNQQDKIKIGLLNSSMAIYKQMADKELKEIKKEILEQEKLKLQHERLDLNKERLKLEQEKLEFQKNKFDNRK